MKRTGLILSKSVEVGVEMAMLRLGIMHTIHSLSMESITRFGPDQAQTIGSGPVAIANPDLKWETGEQVNVGLDADFLEGRWNVIFDLYEKTPLTCLHTFPILAPRAWSLDRPMLPLRATEGPNWPLGTKAGEGDFTYNFNGNISAYQNQVHRFGCARGQFEPTHFHRECVWRR